MAELTSIIQELKNEKGFSEELIRIVLEDSLKAAYKKRFGTDENIVVDFSDDNSEVALYSKKTIVTTMQEDISVFEIELEDAKKFEPECEVGDQLLIEIKPRDFTRSEALVASQRATQRIREFEGDLLQSEFKNKLNEIVIGYCLREVNKNVIVDLGKVEGMLPKRFQTPKEVYRVGDRVKALIHSVERTEGHHLEVVLSRTHTDFVKKIFELEIPELYDGTIEIVKIVREPGYRTKVAVRSLHSEIDPVGTCVGARGSRINNIILELDGERIDVLHYDSDQFTFIHNALSPAEVKQVIVMDRENRSAIAVVEDENFPIAIGKLGLNVRLANRLTDWNINVKTESEFKEMNTNNELIQSVFSDESDAHHDDGEVDIAKVRELPNMRADVVSKLENAGIEYIEDLLQISDSQLFAKNLSSDEVVHMRKVLQEIIEVDAGTVENVQHTAHSDEASNAENDDQDISIRELSLSDSIVEKLKDAGITKIYDLAMLYSERKLDTLVALSEDERNALETVIKENIEYEE